MPLPCRGHVDPTDVPVMAVGIMVTPATPKGQPGKLSLIVIPDSTPCPLGQCSTLRFSRQNSLRRLVQRWAQAQGSPIHSPMRLRRVQKAKCGSSRRRIRRTSFQSRERLLPTIRTRESRLHKVPICKDQDTRKIHRPWSPELVQRVIACAGRDPERGDNSNLQHHDGFIRLSNDPEVGTPLARGLEPTRGRLGDTFKMAASRCHLP